MQEAGNPYSTPASDLTLPEEEISDILVPASRGARFGAALIDGAILGLVLFAAKRIGTITTITDRIEAAINTLPYALLLHFLLQSLLAFVIFVAIQGYFLAENGQTIGKKALNIKIVTLQGTMPRMEALLFRRDLIPTLIYSIPFAGGYIFLLGILFIFTRPKRCLHDYIAGTKVVVAKTLPKGITGEKNETKRVPLRFPELILAPIIRGHLGREPQALTEATSWAGDLGMQEDGIRAFLEEIDHALPSSRPQRKNPSRTYGELLAALDIPITKMMRVPGKVTYRAPAPPR